MQYETRMSCGLVKGHAYSVTAVEEVRAPLPSSCAQLQPPLAWPRGIAANPREAWKVNGGKAMGGAESETNYEPRTLNNVQISKNLVDKETYPSFGSLGKCPLGQRWPLEAPLLVLQPS